MRFFSYSSDTTKFMKAMLLSVSYIRSILRRLAALNNCLEYHRQPLSNWVTSLIHRTSSMRPGRASEELYVMKPVKWCKSYSIQKTPGTGSKITLKLWQNLKLPRTRGKNGSQVWEDKMMGRHDWKDTLRQKVRCISTILKRYVRARCQLRCISMRRVCSTAVDIGMKNSVLMAWERDSRFWFEASVSIDLKALCLHVGNF